MPLLISFVNAVMAIAPTKATLKRAQIGQAGRPIEGPYAYILGRTNNIACCVSQSV